MSNCSDLYNHLEEEWRKCVPESMSLLIFYRVMRGLFKQSIIQFLHGGRDEGWVTMTELTARSTRFHSRYRVGTHGGRHTEL